MSKCIYKWARFHAEGLTITFFLKYLLHVIIEKMMKQHFEKIQKKTAPTIEHNHFHFCIFLSCYWFLKWPELIEIPRCLLEMNSWFLSRRNCLHRIKGRRGKKIHLAIQSNSIFFFNSINRTCSEQYFPFSPRLFPLF